MKNVVTEIDMSHCVDRDGWVLFLNSHTIISNRDFMANQKPKQFLDLMIHQLEEFRSGVNLEFDKKIDLLKTLKTKSGKKRKEKNE